MIAKRTNIQVLYPANFLEPDVKAGAIAGVDACKSMSIRGRGEMVQTIFSDTRKSTPLSPHHEQTNSQGVSANSPVRVGRVHSFSTVELVGFQMDVQHTQDRRGLNAAPSFWSEVNNIGQTLLAHRRGGANFLLPLVTAAPFTQFFKQVCNHIFKRLHTVLQNQSLNDPTNKRIGFRDVRTAFEEIRIRGWRHEAH